jgi:hypothetical protein
MEEIFREYFEPPLDQRGYLYAGKNRWVRENSAGFKHMFYLYPFRPGADYYAKGALSFDYVPRVAAGKVRIRPEAKHARVHPVIEGGMGEDRKFERSRATARQKCQARAEGVADSICRQPASFKSLQDVLARFRSRIASGDFPCYPECALSFAFTLAKVGETAKAKAEIEDEDEEAKAKAKIRSLFGSGGWLDFGWRYEKLPRHCSRFRCCCPCRGRPNDFPAS